MVIEFYTISLYLYSSISLYLHMFLRIVLDIGHVDAQVETDTAAGFPGASSSGPYVPSQCPQARGRTTLNVHKDKEPMRIAVRRMQWYNVPCKSARRKKSPMQYRRRDRLKPSHLVRGENIGADAAADERNVAPDAHPGCHVHQLEVEANIRELSLRVHANLHRFSGKNVCAKAHRLSVLPHQECLEARDRHRC